jgi:hypothetical protein
MTIDQLSTFAPIISRGGSGMYVAVISLASNGHVHLCIKLCHAHRYILQFSRGADDAKDAISDAGDKLKNRADSAADESEGVLKKAQKNVSVSTLIYRMEGHCARQNCHMHGNLHQSAHHLHDSELLCMY